MSHEAYTDRFVIVNGPEDGAEFPITRAPFHVGADPACTVNVRLDPTVREQHALLSVVPEGYRVRRADVAPVYINGKRTGMLRSRIVRPGQLLQVGHTLLALECPPDGLASRSHGIITETDLGWAIRQGIKGAYRLVRGALGTIWRIFGRVLGSWLAIAAILGALYFFWPRFHYFVNGLLWGVYGRLLALIPRG